MQRAIPGPQGRSTGDPAILQSATGSLCRPAPHKIVGDEENFAAAVRCVAPRELSPAELEAHITSLGKLMERAQRLGDRQNLRQLHDLRMDAIRSRSPAHQAAMEAEIQRRIDEGVGYFSSEAAQALGRGGAR